MTEPDSFLWHDYETFGADVARDRPAQFAAIRTNAALEEIEEPLQWYCQPSPDVLPHPDAVLLTGITPQLAQREGMPEYRFAENIHQAFMRPGTCGVGYNSIRFDDEVTRHLFYRNFFDPYQREWRGGNSRWDLIDVVRLWHALRPEGLHWPAREDSGGTSFKLEHLAAVNDLGDGNAHDALSDVRTTIALARRLRTAQPRLFAHALKLRNKTFAHSLLALEAMEPVLHVSSKISAKRGCLALVVPVATHPTNNNCIITFDLDGDVDALLAGDVELLRERVFAKETDLPDGLARLPLKGVHLNKSPMLAPLSTLTVEQAGRWGINIEYCRRQRDRLFEAREHLRVVARAIFEAPEHEEADAELSLYAGFIPDRDRPLLEKVQHAAPESLWRYQDQFGDARLNTLLFRYRARHWPGLLTDEEGRRWQQFVARKLQFDTGLASLTLEAYRDWLAYRMAQASDTPQRGLLQKLFDWPVECGLESLLKAAANDSDSTEFD
jgi:exodeoxyribonuclease I